MTPKSLAATRPEDGSSIEDSQNARALTRRYAPPVFANAPSGLLENNPRAMHPNLPRPCLLFKDGLCRAIRDKRVIGLAAVQTAALIADGVTTRQFLRRGYVEVDPVARIFLGSKPTWGRMAPLGTLQVLGGMWLAERMETSHHGWIRRLWWLPQAVGIAGNTLATANNVRLR